MCNITESVATTRVTEDVYRAAQRAVWNDEGGELITVIPVRNGAMCAEACIIEQAGIGGRIDLDLITWGATR